MRLPDSFLIISVIKVFVVFGVLMTTPVLASEMAPPRRIYYGWVNLAVAALAMVATLPGRTQGIGLITEPLLADLHLSATDFATLNLWATLIGSGGLFLTLFLLFIRLAPAISISDVKELIAGESHKTP